MIKKRLFTSVAHNQAGRLYDAVTLAQSNTMLSKLYERCFHNQMALALHFPGQIKIGAKW